MSYLGSAVVNVPLSDTLAVRATGFYRNIGGFIDSVGIGGSDVAKNINESKSYGGRGSLLFRPSSDLSIQLSAYVQNLDNDAPDAVDADPMTGGHTLRTADAIAIRGEREPDPLSRIQRRP